MQSYNGETCGNYEIGNPWVYRGHNLAWKNVHRLASYDNITFDYNYAGIRTKKTVNSVTTKYAINEDKILSEQKGSDTTTRIDYYYGFDGVTGFKYSNEKYYYKKNAFGDILAIYDSFGNLVAKYVYDAWGNHKVLNPDGTENASTTFIGNINPYRYRSYYFDTEIGLYYLKSRYYDPEVGRFISMDAVEYIAPNIINGLNLYAYCVNNPIMGYDPNGTIWPLIAVGGLLVGLALTLTACSKPEEPTAKPQTPITSEDININGNNPDGSINVKITTGNIHIDNSYRITNEKDQEKVIEIIMASELYTQYGFYRSKDSYLSEWRAHNWLYDILPEWTGYKDNAQHVDLNKDPEGGVRGLFYGLF